jgi:hypothetical protein
MVEKQLINYFEHTVFKISIISEKSNFADIVR